MPRRALVIDCSFFILVISFSFEFSFDALFVLSLFALAAALFSREDYLGPSDFSLSKNKNVHRRGIERSSGGRPLGRVIRFVGKEEADRLIEKESNRIPGRFIVPSPPQLCRSALVRLGSFSRLIPGGCEGASASRTR